MSRGKLFTNTHTHTHSRTLNSILPHIYIYIYRLVIDPVNPKLGTIPSRTISIFKYRILKLNHPTQELSANKIYGAKNFFKKKKIKNKKKNNNRSYYNDKFIFILLKSIEINQCSKKLPGHFQINSNKYLCVCVCVCEYKMMCMCAFVFCIYLYTHIEVHFHIH